MKNSFGFIKKHIFLFCFLAFIFFMFVNYLVSAGSVVIENIVDDGSSENPEIEYIDEYYELKANPTGGQADDSSVLKSLENKWRRLTNFATSAPSFVFSDSLLNGNAMFCRAIGMEYIPGTTFLKLDDNMMTYLVDDGKVNTKKQGVDERLNYLNAFSEILKDQGIDVTYFITPNKEYSLMSYCPVGLRPNEQFDLYEYERNLLENLGIPHVELVTDKNIDNYELFYKTDHHWKTEYGIAAAKQICDYLNKSYDYGIDLSVYNEENYEKVVYEDVLFGSIGTNATKGFADAEDMSIRYPKNDSTYTFLIPSKNVDLKGGFDVFINRKNLDDEKQWPFNAYAAYIYANSAYVSVENTQIEDDHRVLIIKDSFANAVVPYLAQSIKNVDVIDIRDSQADYFNESVLELVKENKYDNILFVASEPFDMKLLFVK